MLVSARRFEELGAATPGGLSEVEAVERSARKLQAPELEATATPSELPEGEES